MNPIEILENNARPGIRSGGGSIRTRTILFTNYITPYLSPVLRQLTNAVDSLRICLSTVMEPDRSWEPNWDGLEVTLQKSFSTVRRQRHIMGFETATFRHFPYDTLPILFRYRPDVVISSQLGFRTIQAVVYRLICPQSRLVVWVDCSEHTERGIGRVRTAIRRILGRTADAVLVIGSSGARYMRQIGISPNRIIQAPYVTETGPFYSVSLQRDTRGARRLLYVGRLIEGKGLEAFVQEMARFIEAHPARELELWFVGDGPLRISLERIPLPPGLSLTFLGSVSYPDLSQYYGQAGACVLPTLSDTWGLVVNEALAAGVPVLGSRYSQAVEELIQDGVNGWRFRPDCPGETQGVLENFLSASDEELARMRCAARETVRHLTPEYMAGLFLKAIAMANSTRKGPDGISCDPPCADALDSSRRER
jgi:glycosyltransferase involved in cell wall biosynthesis